MLPHQALPHNHTLITFTVDILYPPLLITLKLPNNYKALLIKKWILINIMAETKKDKVIIIFCFRGNKFSSGSLCRVEWDNIVIHAQTLLQVDTSIVIRVDGLAEVDGVSQLLLEHRLAGVAGQLQQEEARVRLGQVVVSRVILVQNL